MSTVPPSDLSVLCRKLASIPSQQLPHALPSLVNHVLRCKQALAAPQDTKLKGDKSECAMLVHKLKASITTLLNSRTKEARFVAISLVKATVDVGGWEVLRGSEPWVRGLLSIVQKGDPIPSKELGIVTLTRIFVLLHPYQTLVREIATPTIPAFATACIQLLKSFAADSAALAPTAAETICNSLSSLIPLYPTTLRPFSSQTLAVTKRLLAPTISDEIFIPDNLQEAARRLVILQHHVAAKSGGSDEWAKHVNDILNELHNTADQVFRAIDEPSEFPGGRLGSQVNLEIEPSSGGSSSSQYPPWSGIQAGSQRLAGLLHYLSDCLLYSTRGAVAIPLGKVIEFISRVCLIARQFPKSQTWEQALQTKAAIGREEKEELWSALPDIHVAALQVVRTGFGRLADDMTPIAPELLDHVVRVFNSGISLPIVRHATYETLSAILPIVGPTLSKPFVEALGTVVGACCRDLQEDAGYLKLPPKGTSTTTDSKKNGIAINADLFLKQPQATSETQTTRLEEEHRATASKLLALFLSHLPQRHIKPSLRGLLDQTAVITQNRDAMVSSVLNPFTDPRGCRYPSVLPHLTQNFPQDQSLEILRTNLRTEVRLPSGDELASIEEEEGEEEAEDAEMGEDMGGEAGADTRQGGTLVDQAKLPEARPLDTELPIKNNPFESRQMGKTSTHSGFGDIQHRAYSPPKRKHEEASSPVPQKRQEVEITSEAEKPAFAPGQSVDKPGQDEDEDDSDESVHLNMELEDDDEDEEQ